MVRKVNYKKIVFSMKKEKKIFKNMNILLIICILVFGEVFAYINEIILGAKLHNGKIFAPYSMKIEKFENKYQQAKLKDLGKKYGENYKDKPLILFGGSYVYGYGLEDKDRLPYILSEYIKKPVYNRAFQTWSAQNMLWQLKNPEFYSETEEPQAIIYMGVKVDLDNIYNPDILNGLRYFEKNNELIEAPFIFMLANYSYLFKKINQEISYKKTLDRTKSIKFFNKHILESKNEIDKHWKNVKIYVVWYDLPITEDFDELEKQGIKVISLDDFMKQNILPYKKYKNSDVDIHPNGLAWQKIVPELVKKTGL